MKYKYPVSFEKCVIKRNKTAPVGPSQRYLVDTDKNTTETPKEFEIVTARPLPHLKDKHRENYVGEIAIPITSVFVADCGVEELG